MNFRLKITRFALILVGYCATSCYGAAIADGLEDHSAIRPITHEQAIDDKTLRDRFFDQGFIIDQRLFDDLMDTATDNAAGSNAARSINTKNFLEEAASHGCLSTEVLKSVYPNGAAPLKLLARHLQGILTGAALVLQRDEVGAFISPRAFVPEPVALPPYLAVSKAICTLPLAEQMYLLNVRGNLAGEYLPPALDRLSELLSLVQQIALADRSQEKRSAHLVSIIGKVRGIAPVISEYLKSINTQSVVITDGATKVIPGALFGDYWVSKETKYTREEQSRLTQLETRRNLIVAVFDALFGTIIKPASIQAPTAFTTDPSPANQLVAAVYRLYPSVAIPNITATAVVSRAGAVDHEIMQGCFPEFAAATAAFLSKVLSTPNSAALTTLGRFDTPEAAIAYVQPPVVAPLVVEDKAAELSSTVVVEPTADISKSPVAAALSTSPVVTATA